MGPLRAPYMGKIDKERLATGFWNRIESNQATDCNNFIHGCVVCCSVTDLVDVTGVDAQLILTRLLNNERKTTLVTRGPYNGMFSQKTGSQGSLGFSIDVPVETSTINIPITYFWHLTVTEVSDITHESIFCICFL